MRYDHECIEWDGMRIDESCSEFYCCRCYDEPDAKRFSDMHSEYINQLQQAWSISNKKANSEATHNRKCT